MDSERIACDYYDRLGGDGLRDHATDEQTLAELGTLTGMLSPEDTVLDVACGYGRITVPLSLDGFDVVGVDLSSEMVRAAEDFALESGVRTRFLQGDIRSLPFDDCSFSVVLCLWSSFSSLLSLEDQLDGLAELSRVLAPGGWALIDLPDGDDERWKVRLKGVGVDGRVVPDYFVGGGNAIYLHDLSSARSLLSKGPFERFDARRVRFGGRRRLLLFLGS